MKLDTGRKARARGHFTAHGHILVALFINKILRVVSPPIMVKLLARRDIGAEVSLGFVGVREVIVPAGIARCFCVPHSLIIQPWEEWRAIQIFRAVKTHVFWFGAGKWRQRPLRLVVRWGRIIQFQARNSKLSPIGPIALRIRPAEHALGGGKLFKTRGRVNVFDLKDVHWRTFIRLFLRAFPRRPVLQRLRMRRFYAAKPAVGDHLVGRAQRAL